MLIAVNKHIGPTSHDIVAGARRQLGTRRVGHAGTLDPLASGLLLLLTDEHTRLSRFLTGADKTYLAWVSFGGTTPTLDAEGPLVPSGRVPDLQELEERLPGLLAGFLAVTEQRPPAFSAVKQAGVRGYEAARRGEDPDLPPRRAGYAELELLATAPDPARLPVTFSERSWRPAREGVSFSLPPVLAPLPSALVLLRVRAGTYIRSFARDLGSQLGTGAFLSGLTRVKAGRLDLADAVAPDALAEAPGLAPLDVLGFPVVQLDGEEAARVRQGQRLRPSFAGTATLVDPAGRLAAIAVAEDGRMRFEAVFPA